MPEDMNLVILLRQPPHGSLYPVEGLRMAVATEDFDPLVIAINDGVYTFMKKADKAVYQTHINFLKEIGLEIWADEKALEERGLTKEDLMAEVDVKSHKEVLDSIVNANTIIPL